LIEEATVESQRRNTSFKSKVAS